MYIFTLPSTLTKEMNAVEEKLREFFELVTTAEKLKECLCFKVKTVRDPCQNKMKGKFTVYKWEQPTCKSEKITLHKVTK